MDVVSEVLRVVKLEGALFFNAEFSAPWCLMNSGLKGLSTVLTPTPGHLIIYHFLTEGRAYTQLLEGKRVELTAGDIVVYPHGDPHLLGNGRAKPVDSIKTFSPGTTTGPLPLPTLAPSSAAPTLNTNAAATASAVTIRTNVFIFLFVLDAPPLVASGNTRRHLRGSRSPSFVGP